MRILRSLPSRFLGCAFNIFLGVFLISSSLISAYDQTALLKADDINPIMQQVLKAHVDKKEISSPVLKKSLQIYLDQFDPGRIYLLQSEVQPWLNLSADEIQKIAESYQKNDFSTYSQLNTLIKKSIERARGIRGELDKDRRFLFDQNHIAFNSEEGKDVPYPANIQDLKDRIRQNMMRYFEMQKRRFGTTRIMNHKAAEVAQYEKEQRSFENRYLFRNDLDQPLPSQEQAHFFTLHILKSLAASLDAHTTFFDDIESSEMRTNLAKEYDGVGIVLQEVLDEIIVAAILPGSPAEKNGVIKPNDRIVEIDGKPLTKVSFQEVLAMIEGKSGTPISLVIKRDVSNHARDKEIKVTLTREPIVLKQDRVDVSSESFGNGVIGKIVLHGFYENDDGVSSEKDVREAIRQLNKDGNLKGLVLDLRENTGGYLMQAVKVAGLFISSGVIVVSKYSNGEEKFYRDIDPTVEFDGPLIVLTSRLTASAAEIVAQALQDYGVAIVVGDSHTYGKGSIQTQTVTEKGASSFKVTVGKYYTVSGKSTQIKGVIADIVVPGIYMEEKIGEAFLSNPLGNDSISPAYDDDLMDVPRKEKPWYVRYYIPTLQHRTDKWSAFLPTLKTNSEYRLVHNKNYQTFIKKLKGEPIENTDEDEETAEFNKGHQDFGHEDLQVSEAMNILKDMILMSTKGVHQVEAKP